MDTHVKEGQLYVQHQKFGKKWKKNWFVLYPASQNGIARLEFFDSPLGGGGPGGSSGSGSNEKTRKLDKKIIRLSECISILPALTESCPKDNMAAFCVETNDKTHVFAAEKVKAKEWMDIMCDIAFQQKGSCSSLTDCNGASQDLQMSENLIYCSREEVNEFWVTIQRTESSERCGLAGNYWLKAEKDVLILKEPKTKRNVLVWPYKLLRRYGRDRMMFSFEAGRRCDSGPGNFTFETKQGSEIFTLVERAIQSQKALVEERHLSCPQNFDPDCPLSLQHIRNAVPSAGSAGSGDSSSCSSREADGDSGGSKPGSADGVLGKREGGDGGRGPGSGAMLKGRSLPEPPVMLGAVGGSGTPPRSPRGPGGKLPFLQDEQTGLYSEPADSVRLPLHSFDALYSDPVDSLKAQNQTATAPTPTPRLRPVGDDASGGADQRMVPDLYSNLYDQISLDLTQKTGALNLNGSSGTGRGAGRGGAVNKRPPGGQAEGASAPPCLSLEHIYDEPEGFGKGFMSLPVTLLASFYDEARLEPQSQRRQEDASAPAGQEASYSPPSQGKPTETSKNSRERPGPGRGAQQPPLPKYPKPATAPKPSKGPFMRKEPVPTPPGKPGNSNNNNNMWSTGGGSDKELYSKVCKPKASPGHLWLYEKHRAPLRSPDIISDNLGNI